MNEELLNEFRKAPRQAFADELRARLGSPGDVAPAASRRSRVPWKPLAAAAALLVAATVALTVPTVRVAAQEFLDLFRVKRFVAISVDAERMERLKDGKVDLRTVLGDSVEETKRPAEPHIVASVEDAARDAGIPVLVPTYVFNVNDAPVIRVTDDAEARIAVDAERIRGVLDVLAIEDAEVPAGLDGATVTVRVPRAVSMDYRRGGSQWVATLTQARSPEVDLPEGVDIAALGEIGLRIAGLSTDEARQFSRTIDWRSTMVVPVPASVGSFREVDVRGTTGLLIAIDPGRVARREPADANAPSPRTILLWSENGLVYGLASSFHPADAIQMANSMR